GAVGGCELVEHEVEVAGEADVGSDPADHGLPRVTVRVDEAGDDDAVGRVDHLGVARVDRRADRGDAVVLDEDVAAEDVADLRVHAQDVTAPDQYSLRHDPLRSRCPVRLNYRRSLAASACSFNVAPLTAT